MTPVAYENDKGDVLEVVIGRTLLSWWFWSAAEWSAWRSASNKAVTHGRKELRHQGTKVHEAGTHEPGRADATLTAQCVAVRQTGSNSTNTFVRHTTYASQTQDGYCPNSNHGFVMGASRSYAMSRSRVASNFRAVRDRCNWRPSQPMVMLCRVDPSSAPSDQFSTPETI